MSVCPVCGQIVDIKKVELIKENCGDETVAKIFDAYYPYIINDVKTKYNALKITSKLMRQTGYGLKEIRELYKSVDDPNLYENLKAILRMGIKVTFSCDHHFTFCVSDTMISFALVNITNGVKSHLDKKGRVDKNDPEKRKILEIMDGVTRLMSLFILYNMVEKSKGGEGR